VVFASIVVLKSYSDKDLLPGLEVRLLPHQLIGVNWYEYHYVGFCAYINLRTQDGRPREKVPSQRWHLSVSSFCFSIHAPYILTGPRDEMGLGQLF
jgi:hypothetical protein